MGTNLSRIGERARQSPEEVFTNLYHHVTDVDNLRACYESLPAHKAVGVDGVTKKAYGEDLEDNLRALSESLRQQSYRPGTKRRKYIEKPGSSKKRPLAIDNFEDKLVEQAVKRVLEPIYEELFEPSSYGYRPGRSIHSCLDKLGRTIQRNPVNYVVEADIRSFFDQVNWDWLIKFLSIKVRDQRILRLIVRMLKAGILEDGLVSYPDEGTPQGSIISPLLSNIYLHYVLDIWFAHEVDDHTEGAMYYFRYADDFLVCFQYQNDAERLYKVLGRRLKKYGLSLAEEKTHCIAFGRFARDNARRRGQKPKEFTFLGFTHYCGKTRNGNFKVKRRTSRKKFGQSLRKFSDWARKSRNVQRTGRMIRSAIRRVRGYLNHYAITDNLQRCGTYVYFAKRILFKWLNRKSQRRSYTWEGFAEALAQLGWPELHIRQDLNPFRRAEVF